MQNEPYGPEYFINRELSWLEFNQRVLEEAQDAQNPLLERVKFLSIVCSNLDEFFEIRVAGIKQQIESDSNDTGTDGLEPSEVFRRIHKRVTRMVQDQYTLWENELRPGLASNKIRFHEVKSLKPERKKWTEDYFRNEIYPVLTPLAIDPSHPFPQLLNKSLNIIVLLERNDGEGEFRHAIVQVPRVLNRVIPLPQKDSDSHDFVFLSAVIEEYVDHLFPGIKVLGAYAFRVTRNSDLYIDEEEALNLLRSIEEELRKRNRGAAVRLEVSEKCPGEVREFLLQKFNLQTTDLYALPDPLNLLRLMPVTELAGKPSLKYKPFTPAIATPLLGEQSFFEIMRHEDVLLHHPYHNFSSIVEFLELAANDAKVLAIKMTLYRTSGDSPIVKALIQAARNGKQVTVMVELKARFDEANNIAWARRMEDAGIHVVYGLVGLKTHCKLLFIVRRDSDRIRHYVHLGTGNYHSRTARLYSDLGLLTTNHDLTEEVAQLFNALTGMSEYRGSQKLLVAPFDMKDRFLAMIRRESEIASQGRPTRIFAKMNSLVDADIIAALYDASRAGTQIQLLVRGICCLRPGVAGISDNIEVRSIVDQYLEHSRIFYFHNDGAAEIYLGSADWMPRNLHRRVEVIFPLEDPKLKQHLVKNVIDIYWKDTLKARRILNDGLHERLKPEGKPFRSQSFFMAEAEKEKKHVSAAISKAENTQIPIDDEDEEPL